MNIVFAGYRRWSYQILKNLLRTKTNKWKISGILTTTTSEAKFEKLSLPCVIKTPQELKNYEYKDIVKNFSPDILLFYGWSWIIPGKIYTKYPCLILHTSPLPHYRGGSPLQHQIMAGETMSATTIFKADNGIDTGAVYAQSVFSLSGSLDQIFRRIVKVGTKDTLYILDGIARHTLMPKPQDISKGTYFRRRKSEESELTVKDFQSKTATELYNFIRSLADPYPNAFIKCADGKKLFFTGAKIEP